MSVILLTQFSKDLPDSTFCTVKCLTHLMGPDVFGVFLLSDSHESLKLTMWRLLKDPGTVIPINNMKTQFG